VADLADDPRWSAMRAGDRWAELRSDEHGRELRMGERRTERRVDETGTQLRIVDRWSSVREEPVGYLPDSSWQTSPPAALGAGESPWNSGETRGERIRRERAEQAALPPARRPWAVADDDLPVAHRSLALPAPREPRDDRADPSASRADRRAEPAARDEWRDPRAESRNGRPADTNGYEQRPAGSDGRSRDGYDGRSRTDGYDGRPRTTRPDSRSDRPENRSDLRDDRRAPWSDQRNDRREDWRDQREQVGDDRADDRWVRESSARAGARPRPLGFDNTDERWR
jgi:hypothetical protein